MTTLQNTFINKQQGAATLLTALVLLISITLITLSSSKTVLMETRIVADNHRISQAVASANYAIDLGFNYFDSGGLDQDLDNLTDTSADIDGNGIANEFNNLVLTSSLGSQSTSAELVFDNQADTACVPIDASVDMNKGLLKTTGYSDDGIAKRTITQCVGSLKLLINNGPDQPLIVKGQVELNGNNQIINRYSNITIWSGGEVDFGNSTTLSTYIKSPTANLLSLNQLLTNSTENSQLASNRTFGNGIDIIDGDSSLFSLNSETFFHSFFTVSSRIELKTLAQDSGQHYTNIANALGESGLIWIEGTPGIQVTLGSDGDIGSTDKPAIILINGDFKVTSQNSIYGLVYIVGTLLVTGTLDIIGSSIIEGTNTVNGLPAPEPVLQNEGTLNIIYWQNPTANIFFPGQGAVIDGSWKDW